MLSIICDFNLRIWSGAICTALSTARNRLESTGQQPLKEHFPLVGSATISIALDKAKHVKSTKNCQFQDGKSVHVLPESEVFVRS